jgi:glycosyltransferase involved in cell wall biosynthesis
LSDRKKVLICGVIFGYGGLEGHFLDLGRLLVENGAEVTFAARVANPQILKTPVWRDAPFKVLTTPFIHRGGRYSTAWALATWPFRLSGPYDVLYTSDWTWFVGFLAQFLKPNGYVLGGRGGETVRTRPYPPGVKFFDSLIVETELQASGYELDIPIRSIPHLAKTSNAPLRRAREVDQLRVVYIGRLTSAKGVFDLLDMWPNLAIQPARLDYYGTGSAENALREAIRARGCSSSIEVHGPYHGESEIAAIMEAADLSVLLSDSEGFPMALLESMAYGVPFVATDVGAVNVMAEDNPDVFVVKREKLAMKAAIEEMARRIRNREVFGERLQQYQKRRFGYEKVSRQWLEALLNPEDFWKLRPSKAARNKRFPEVLKEQLWHLTGRRPIDPI